MQEMDHFSELRLEQASQRLSIDAIVAQQRELSKSVKAATDMAARASSRSASTKKKLDLAEDRLIHKADPKLAWKDTKVELEEAVEEAVRARPQSAAQCVPKAEARDLVRGMHQRLSSDKV